MSSKSKPIEKENASVKKQTAQPEVQNVEQLTQQISPLAIQRAKLDPESLTPNDVMQLQRQIGNRAVGQYVRKEAQSAIEGVQAKTSVTADTMDAPLIQRISEQGGNTTTIRMDRWGQGTLRNDGDKIGTSGMTSCVAVAVSSNRGDAIVAHFGGLLAPSKIADVAAEVSAGVSEINARITSLGGTWSGYVWTGVENDTNPISETRIGIIMERLNAEKERVGPYSGGTLKMESGKLTQEWEPPISVGRSRRGFADIL